MGFQARPKERLPLQGCPHERIPVRRLSRHRRARKRKESRVHAHAVVAGRAFRKTETLAKERTTDAYREIARLLADVREALAGTARSDLAEIQAVRLKSAHPTLKVLTSELRKEGFLKK
jgi:hypothetical protein